jgi:hypothetical protein
LVFPAARWQATGVDLTCVGNLQLHLANLGGRTLGHADEAHHTSWLDNNAAGWGWFVDRSPGDDPEFSTAGDQGEQNHMDLLTTLEHEVGHLLGYDHAVGTHRPRLWAFQFVLRGLAPALEPGVGTNARPIAGSDHHSEGICCDKQARANADRRSVATRLSWSGGVAGRNWDVRLPRY